ncbi:PadR family transcriptional regulator [Actinomadura flavalba]|uniref:PadR family transcriptional regulator n=1 Tax=Actinomadura flavalba TaxID=1120938 RepID=UPI00037AE879|nr:PadR family transcriptional regulator [Actinomadura flavalba]
MSPVFGHGRLRLYLLKLLEESPRHGYEVIRLLQDRFMGVYSPSPGTIYPRLSRLESEGLVTHEIAAGKKIYSITDAGRAELARREEELADLEDELTASAQQIARDVQQDVRQTVRSLREELSQAARTVRKQGRAASSEAWRGSSESAKGAWSDSTDAGKDAWQDATTAGRDAWHDTAEATREALRGTARTGREAFQDTAGTAKDAWRDATDTTKDEFRRQRDHWRDQASVWKDEWRRNWDEAWRTATGARPDPTRLHLERLLSTFLDDVRTTVTDAGLTDAALARLEHHLDETRSRLHDDLSQGG